MLVRSLNFRALTILILVGVLALTAIMFLTTPRELAPEEDQGVIFALVKAPQYGNLDYIEKATGQLHEFVTQVPEAEHLFAINGYQGVTSGFGGIILKNWDERHRSQKQVLQALSPKFNEITGAKVLGFAPPALPGSTGGPPLQFVVRSIGNYKDIADVMAKIEDAARKSGMFIFTDSDLKFDTPQLEVKIDAAKANRLGISMQDVGSTLATLLGGNYVNRFNLYGRSYEVIPQVPRDFRLTPDWLTRYQLRTAAGDLVPLSTIATSRTRRSPTACRPSSS